MIQINNEIPKTMTKSTLKMNTGKAKTTQIH